MFENIKNKLLEKANGIDIIILSIFAVLISLQPYYYIADFNYFEIGIYLPGIQYILDGLVPYRDFFHLRGPLELYIPAFFMSIFGEHVDTLYKYFYIGTLFTLVIYVLAAKEIIKTRFVLYLLIPVLIGRTFPRVVFHIWGGFRYGLGILAILFAIYFFKHKKFRWMFLSGLSVGTSLLISVEIGACVILSLIAVLIFNIFSKQIDTQQTFKAVKLFSLGILVLIIPYFLYLITTHSLSAYLDNTFSVVTNMTKIFPDYYYEEHPRNFLEALMSMNPGSPHFKHLTPAYCYLFLFLFIIFNIRKYGTKSISHQFILISTFGFIMYVLAFRKIGAGQFEMALQPEKILLFYLCEQAFLFLRSYKTSLTTQQNLGKIIGIYFLFFSFVGSSWGYAIARFNHRFPAFKYVRNTIVGKDTQELLPLNKESTTRLTQPRLKGLIIPSDQAKNIQQFITFIQNNTNEGEPIFMFPELGTYNFLVDRPFIGRFPIVTFSWINDQWHKELMNDLRAVQPRYAFIHKDPGITFQKAYFKVKKNKEKYDEVLNYVHDNYMQVETTEFFYIYKKK